MKAGDACVKCPGGAMSAPRYVPPRPACASGMPAIAEHLVYECGACGYEHWMPTADAAARMKADAEARMAADAAEFKGGHEPRLRGSAMESRSR